MNKVGVSKFKTKSLLVLFSVFILVFSPVFSSQNSSNINNEVNNNNLLSGDVLKFLIPSAFATPEDDARCRRETAQYNAFLESCLGS